MLPVKINTVMNNAREEQFLRVSSIFHVTCGKLVHGRMAEWSIAAVLKTAGLTAPGVRIPLLPSRRQITLFISWSVWSVFHSGIAGQGRLAPA